MFCSSCIHTLVERIRTIIRIGDRLRRRQRLLRRVERRMQFVVGFVLPVLGPGAPLLERYAFTGSGSVNGANVSRGSYAGAASGSLLRPDGRTLRADRAAASGKRPSSSKIRKEQTARSLSSYPVSLSIVVLNELPQTGRLACFTCIQACSENQRLSRIEYRSSSCSTMPSVSLVHSFTPSLQKRKGELSSPFFLSGQM